MERLLRGLQSSAAPLLQQFGAADPTGAFLAIARDWIGASKVRSVDGVWFAPGRDRALILARTRAGGLDIAGQDAVDAAVRQAFAGADPGSARLLAAGPAVFAREAAHAIRSDVERLSIASTVLVAALLLWRFRSPWVIGVIAVPVLLGIAAAALVVQFVFGFVHGVAVGFGMTMLGVTVDYPVLLVGHRKQGEAAPATLRRIGQAFTLAVLTAALGLTGMLFSGFPGLSQLGCFSIVGILVAAAATRWLLPPLIVAADLAPVSAGEPARLAAHRTAARLAWLGHWRLCRRRRMPACHAVGRDGRATLRHSAPSRALHWPWMPSCAASSARQIRCRLRWCRATQPRLCCAKRKACFRCSTC